MKRFHIRSREIHRESENGSLKSLKPFSFSIAKLNNTKNVQLPTYPASYKEPYLTSTLNKLQYHSSSFTYILVTNTYELSIQSYRNIVIIRDIYIYKIVSYRILGYNQGQRCVTCFDRRLLLSRSIIRTTITSTYSIRITPCWFVLFDLLRESLVMSPIRKETGSVCAIRFPCSCRKCS